MQSEYVLSTPRLRDLPKNERPHIAFIGRSNVGKSSLINALTQRKDLARTSAEPGRTQTLNLYSIDRTYYLVDLPGYGYAKTSRDRREVFAELIENYLLETPQLRLAFLIVDARIGPTDLDQNMIAFLQMHHIPFVMIVNKMDKLKKTEAQKLLHTIGEHFAGMPIIPHSNVAEGNRSKILRTLQDALSH